MARRVLVWTEADGVGGHDRYLADLLGGLDDPRFELLLSGNPDAAFDAWLGERVPRYLPRRTVRVATLPGSPLERLRRRVGARGVGETGAATETTRSGALAVDEGPLARRAAVAALRYRQLAFNVARLRRLMRGTRPDVLFVNNGGYPGGESCRAAVLAAGMEGVPRVVHYVHNLAYPPFWPARAERRLDARIDAATTWWATGAHRASEALTAARGFSRVRTVHYGVRDFAAPSPARDVGFAPGALNLAMVAAFEPRKGHRVLLEALRSVRADVRVALVGTGPELEAARELADERVTFCGWREDVPAVLAAADGLVLPSLANECLPYAILEAMSAGLPAIGTDVAGIPEEIEDGVSGYVVPPGDAPALAAAIERLAADPAAARRMGAAGRRRAREHFSIDRMVSETVALWEPG